MIDLIFEKMKTFREEKELTQKEIAKILNVDRSTYAGWEIGKDTIPLRKLNDFCNHFNLSIDYIAGLSKVNNQDFVKKQIDVIEVGNNLRKIRMKENLKQRDIFTMLNTTSSTYSAYETGKVLIQTSFVYKIAEKYDYSIDWILGKTK